MATSLTHSYIGDLVLEALAENDKAKQIIQKNHKAYKLGAFGPDILMGLVLSSDAAKRNAGETLHNDFVFAGILSTAKYLRQNPHDHQVFAYLMGYMTHYAADSTIHPYVNNYIKNRMERKYDPKLLKCLHTIIETEMDTYVDIVFLKGKNANSAYLYSTSKRQKEILNRFYLHINKDVFRLPLKAKDIKKSCFFCKMMMFFCHRHKNGSKRFKLLNRVDKLFKAEHLLVSALRPRVLDTRHDYLNRNKVPFAVESIDPNCTYVNYDFLQMIEVSKIRGMGYINQLTDFIFLGKQLDLRDYELNFNGRINKEYAQAVNNNDIKPRKKSVLQIDIPDEEKEEFNE